MKKYLLIHFVSLLCSLPALAQPTSAQVWLNEFHYDGITNYGQADQNEFVEFAVHNSIANNPVEMAKLKLVLYTAGSIENGTPVLFKGKTYDSTGLLYSANDAVHNFQTGGFTKCSIGATDFSLISKTLPILQDVPTALAIIYDNTIVVQLLSYEKPFKIAPAGKGGGAAFGKTTTVIMVAPGDTATENATTAVNHSIGLMGNGITYTNFSWRDDIAMVATPCAPNMDATGNMQTFTGGPLPAGIIFSLRTSNRDVLLQWTGAPENAGTKFMVEQSPENSIRFAEIKTLNGLAQTLGTTHDYQLQLNNVDPGIYNFRIKQVSATGQIIYSSILKAFVKTSYGYLLSGVYPNPVSAKASLTLSLEKSQKVTMELFNGLGQKIKTIREEMFVANQTHIIQMKLDDIGNGKYYLVVKGEFFKETRPVIVAH